MIKQLMLASLTAFFVLPMCVFTHELGHYSVAISHGWSTKLQPIQVTYLLNGQTEFQRILFLLGGPILDILQVGSGLAILFWLRNDSSRSVKFLYWCGIVLTFVSVKWLLTPVAAAFMPKNDEIQISRLLGWYPMVVPVLVMLMGIPALIHVFRQHCKVGSWISLLFVPVFGALGGMTWAWIIGPFLLNAR